MEVPMITFLRKVKLSEYAVFFLLVGWAVGTYLCWKHFGYYSTEWNTDDGDHGDAKTGPNHTHDHGPAIEGPLLAKVFCSAAVGLFLPCVMALLGLAVWLVSIWVFEVNERPHPDLLWGKPPVEVTGNGKPDRKSVV